jgi:ADP-ribose diphosphatase
MIGLWLSAKRLKMISSMPNKPPRIQRKRLLAKTQVFRIEAVELQFSNGEQRQYERLLGGAQGSVLVLPLLDSDTLLLIREYAVGSERYELAFPKGRIESGEDMLQAADREIREEIGYGARDLTLLRSVNLAPGYIQHQTHLVLARDLFANRQIGDEPEPIEVVPWRLSDAGQLLAREDFTEARSILALLLFLRQQQP